MLQQMWFESSIVSSVMLINSVCDIKKREIYPGMTLIAALAGIVFKILKGYSGEEIILALVPGIIILAFGIILKGKVGLGDALVLLFLGAWLEKKSMFIAFIIANFLIVPFAIVGIIRKQKEKELPFVPFLFAGVIITAIVEWIG